MLPGVAYLEMAHEAVQRAVGKRATEEGPVVVIRNIVWARPIVVENEPVTVDIELDEDESGEIAFQIQSTATDAPVLHANGRVTLLDADGMDILDDVEQLDLDYLRCNCYQRIEPAFCYEIYESAGIEYGPTHRGLETVSLGTTVEELPYVLASVALPKSAAARASQYTLHPGLLDSALQAAIGLELAATRNEAAGGARTFVPFGLDELAIVRRVPERCFVYLQPATDSYTGDDVRKLNMYVCDEAGMICVRLLGFTSRALKTTESSSRLSPGHAALLIPQWEAAIPTLDIVSSSAGLCVIASAGAGECRDLRQEWPHARTLELTPENSIEQIAASVGKLGDIGHLVWVVPAPASFGSGEEDLIGAQEGGVLSGFRLIKALLKAGYGPKALEFTIITTQAVALDHEDPLNAAHASIHGLIGSLAKEYGHWRVRLIDLPSGGERPWREALRLPVDGQGNPWVYRRREWFTRTVVPCKVDAPQALPYRRGGVYVLIGGAGGLGEVLSEHLIRRYQAQTIWIGRRPLDATIQGKIDRLAACGGPAPHYVCADATDRAALERAYDEIIARYSCIHGVAQAAIVLLDRSLANMDEERFRAGLAAKVNVSVYMAEVFGRRPLDFAVFFSSFQSFACASGQSNYAAGCAFKDAFAQRLARLWPCAVKVVNWGYWGSVGIVATPVNQERMAQIGVESIEAEEGMQALDSLLGGPFVQLAFLKTRQPLGEASDMQLVELPQTVPSISATALSGQGVCQP